MRRMLLVAACFIPAGLWSGTPNYNGADYYVVVDKSENTITLYNATDWLVQWPCTFGNNDISDKLYQGDRRTPEGRFKITSKYPHKKWNKFMRLDYPTKTDYEKFEQRKQQGIIPAGAKIGGDIGIHGTWPHEEWAVENLQPWTQGCISMRNDHLNELYNTISIGTTVIIKK
ncbi:MAG TPA: L,D-transpeptidase [Phnomibacter sp.]|nr:L,D-transpeptidase [Phnomibacter sp.]